MIQSSSQRKERPALGIFLRILSGFFFAAMVVCIKKTSSSVPLGQVVFFRSFLALIPLILFLRLRKEFPHGLKTQRPFGHLLRSGLGAAAMFASFASLEHLSAAEASLIAHLTPVFTVLAGALVLSERPTFWRIGGVILGLSGVLVLVWPELGLGESSGSKLLGYGLGLIMAILTSFALIMVRSLNKTESPGAIAFWFVLVSMVGGIATLPWGWIQPDGTTLVFLILSGIFGGLAHISMTLALRNAEASRLAPFEYLALIWPVLADLLIFRLSIGTPFLRALPLVLAGAVLAAIEQRPGKRLSPKIQAVKIKE